MDLFKSIRSLLCASHRPGPIALETSALDNPLPTALESLGLDNTRPTALETSGLDNPRPVALESSALGKLPPELILHIVQFLPPDSAASFSLCCQPIYFVLGKQCLKALEQDEQLDRYRFLTLLERELPNHIVCYPCKKLHAISNAHRHRYSSKCYSGTARKAADITLQLSVLIRLHFSFIIFQMVMKNHRQGQDCSELLKLLSYETETTYRNGHVEQHTALARVVAGSLLIREQKIIMIHPIQPDPIQWDLDFRACPHFRFLTLPSLELFHNVTMSPNLKGAKDYQNQDGIIQCNYCLTEFRIDFKNFAEHGNAIFLTRWQDFGQGRSPLDDKWRGHVEKDREEWRPVEFERGSICAAFERKEHFRFYCDSPLSPQDKKELFRKGPP